MSEPNRIIADAIHEALQEVTEYHFSSDGLLLFVNGERVGSINWDAASTAAYHALCRAALPTPIEAIR